MTANRTLTWTVSLLGGSFLLSMALYLIVPGTLTRAVLLFPDELSKQTVAEVRSLPFNWDREHNVELLVREVLLGPAKHDHLRLLSRQGGVTSVLLRGDTVYLDLTKESFIPDPDVIYSPMRALDVLKETLVSNFAGVSKIWISVGGEPSRAIVVDKG